MGIERALRWQRANPERYRANMRRWRQRPDVNARARVRAKKWHLANREKNLERFRSSRLRAVLRGMPDDPFVREILTGLFMARSEALRAAYARNTS